ncbi:ATP-binding protein, partial [Klebsiella oxytoca]
GVTDCSIRLEIPEDTGSVPAHALCVVVGNLLENAVAACTGADAPFIRMRGRLADGILTIVMDNRYASVSRMPEGGFLSGKPGGG